MLGTKNDEILTCLLLIVVGYTIAKMFSKRFNGFSVGVTESTIKQCPSRNVGSCIGHYTNCDHKYTDDTSGPGYHTCKDGAWYNFGQCISSGNECRLGLNKSCTLPTQCMSGSCSSTGKCTKQ